MDTERALDDIRVIRRVMQRTRKELGRESGWFGILWGIIWLIGFLGSQFLDPDVSGPLWAGLNVVGGAISVWLGMRMGRRQGSRMGSVGWRVLGWWVTLAVFVAVLVWLLDLRSLRELTLLIVLTIALSYVQVGLFSDGRLAGIGLLLAVLVVAASVLFPDHLFLVMAFLGGGVLMGNGIRTLRSKE